MFKEKQNRIKKRAAKTSQWSLAITGFVIAFMIPAALAESFDQPLQKKIVNLGPSTTLMPNYPAHIQLSCFYYPAFLVKELYDQGVKGAQWVTIEPILNGQIPPCRMLRGPNEQFIDEEGRFFIGAKGSLLFLEESEGDENSGTPFRVIDWKTGKKLFEDSIWSRPKFAHTPDGRISMSYLRAVGEDCSIPKDGTSCWNKFRQKFGLQLAEAPKCDGYRHEGDKKWVPGDAGIRPEEIDVPSAIAYPVTVELFPQQSIKANPGRVRCWAK